MTIKATLELRICQEHQQAVVIFAEDFCPLCAALEEKRELGEIIADQEQELANFENPPDQVLDRLEKEMVDALAIDRNKGNGSEEATT